MSFLAAYRDREHALQLAEAIKSLASKLPPLKIMHVCGTHEWTITHFGLRSLLPGSVEVRAGPGCPVCITPASEIDLAAQLALDNEDVVLTTFVDVLRVPGSKLSLAYARSQGADIRVVYSVADSVKLALKNPRKEVVHFAIGFETTAPSTAAEILQGPPENFSIICSHRLIPPVMDYLLSSGEVDLQGFICPGHVSTIIGVKPYLPLAEKHGVPMVIAGFEPIDVLIAVNMILLQLLKGEHRVENEYTRAVRYEGNVTALDIMWKVFIAKDSHWRGIGSVPSSGLQLKEEYSHYDAIKKFNRSPLSDEAMPPGCRCGDVLKGLIYPEECPLFGEKCTPSTPVGPCMVSLEGSCAIAFKHGVRRKSG